MRVSNEVLKVLSDAEVSGNSLVLQGQLDRAMYLSVNKVLDAAGWTWNRKAKAHTCDGEAVDVLEQILLTGVVTVAKDEFEFFRSPAPVVDELIALAQIERWMDVCEPEAGDGAIACRLQELVDTKVICCELMPANCAKLRALGFDPREADFLTVPARPLFDRVVMNPPFSRQQDIKHVMHASKFLKESGRLVSVMSNGITFRSDNLTNQFRALLEASDGEIIKLPQGAFKESGTMVNTVAVTLCR